MALNETIINQFQLEFILSNIHFVFVIALQYGEKVLFVHDFIENSSVFVPTQSLRVLSYFFSFILVCNRWMASKVGQHGQQVRLHGIVIAETTSKLGIYKQWPIKAWNGIYEFFHDALRISLCPLYLCECEYNFDSMLHTSNSLFLPSFHAIPAFGVCSVYVPFVCMYICSIRWD